MYDIAVIGGGAAGAMAAIRAGSLGRSVALIERNDAIGKKMLITGKGRCNLTNTASLDTFIKNFGRQGEFLRSAFFVFFNEDLMDFFRSAGLETKVERQGRVFPATDSARSVVETLKKCLATSNVKTIYNARLTSVRKAGDRFHISLEGHDAVEARRVIFATGGASYKATGSTGDSFTIAEALGHKVVPLSPGLVPLKTKEGWVKDLQGLGLENVRLVFGCGRKKALSEIGELMFTHFGVSGPLVLDLSSNVLAMMDERKKRGEPAEANLHIDLKPGLSETQLEMRLLKEFKAKGKTQFRNAIKGYLPQRLIDVFVKLSGIDPAREANQITQKQRRAVIGLFKAFPLTITGSLPLEEAMVTGGGVSTKDIDPRTMESRVVPGLYFAGEMIDGCAASGGYNLQQAFSTGYLAGEKAAKSL
jgi:predicted Rossmann fold flavoprotein